MSRYSGKCDLYDHIMISTGTQYDDIASEIQAVETFKERTGGVLYQSYPIRVTRENLDFVKEHSPFFDYKIETVKIPDRRNKSGAREEDHITCYYLDEPYSSIEALNKARQVYIRIEVYFNDILDLIPYYPYLIAVAAHDPDSDYVEISSDPYPKERMIEALRFGNVPYFPQFYNRYLQEHYLAVCSYLNKEGKKNGEKG
ncbi:MAG: hypothetical protein J6S67_08565 [Methanobrevibacter sp.]|nr:hypothetical protein [Methanobrevibacter sp.]